MAYWDAALLGLIQGLSEFLPISSSGHLTLASALFGLNVVGGSALSFEIAVHIGTLLSVLIYFRKRLLTTAQGVFSKDGAESRKLVRYIVIGTIPAALVGLSFKDSIQGFFADPAMTAALLVINGFVLLSTGFVSKSNKTMNLKSSLLIGVAQAAALLPGISRSGSTIATALHLKISPKGAAEFSFLLAIPVILGAVILSVGDFAALNEEQLGVFAVGAIVASVSGYMAIGWMMKLIEAGKFLYFGIYCIVAGATALFFV
ncbi:MAG: undecaprenyl-diphosphate phosphatase [candidate division Zixibacteria bacterium]|nr:undecaprenyl-diphosphate phosphatase [candidate division Zixibacteria bacterium]